MAVSRQWFEPLPNTPPVGARRRERDIGEPDVW